MNWSKLALLVTCLVLGFLPEARADDVLNPKTYHSPSGDFTLFVDPSAPNGSGSAVYRLTRKDDLIWEGKRSFSLWDARVTDLGAVAGYAYEGGVQIGGTHGTGYQDLSVVILAPDGSKLLHEADVEHDQSLDLNHWAGSTSPRVLGILIDETDDRFAVRVPLRGAEHPAVWWTYRISTGKPIKDIVLDLPPWPIRGFMTSLSAQIVPGTSLTLEHWYTSKHGLEGLSRGASLALLDADGQAVWSLEMPGEYDGLGEDWDLYGDLIEPGIIQCEVDELGFRFRSFGSAAAISFELEPEPENESGWHVLEVSRIADIQAGKQEPPKLQHARPVELELLGTTELGSAEPANPISGHFGSLSIDPGGNLGLVRRNPSGSIQFIRVDPEGSILTNVVLDLPKDDKARFPSLAAVSEARWVLLRPMSSRNEQGKAWWLDAQSGALTPIDQFEPRPIESLAPCGDGGFFALARRDQRFSVREAFARIDAEGEMVWDQLKPGYEQSMGVQAATWIQGKGVAALIGTKHTIDFFDQDGKFERSVELNDVLGKRPNYPSGLRADLDGGLILHDFNGSPPIYRINRDNVVTARLHPRFPDGRTFSIRGDVQVAPDGSLWTSDSHSLLRLNAQGIVEKIIGREPSDDALEEIHAIALDPNGRIYAINGRTSSVHMFGSDGTPIRVLRPLPTDFPTKGHGLCSITLDGNGVVYYDMDTSYANPQGPYLALSSEGERLGFNHASHSSIGWHWLFQPGTQRRWVLGYDSVLLVDDQEDPIEITRRPNNKWLERLQDGSVAPDGSLAVIVSPSGFRGIRGPAEMCLYDADGSPMGSFPLGEESIFARVAFDGTTVVTADGGVIRFYDLEGGNLRTFAPPSPDPRPPHWVPTIAPDGQLLLRASRSTKLLRYRMPEA